MSSLDQLVWEHKYRPKTVEDTILPVTTKQMIQGFISTGNIPNMLFAGSAGVGKTTVAYAIANEIGADVLFINASLEGNIDTLRTKITQFVSTVSFTDSKKMVILDECLSEEETVRIGTTDSWTAVKLRDLTLGVDYDIVSFNMKTGQLENDTGRIISDKNDELYDVVLQSGVTVSANKKHPFICVDSNGVFYERTIEEGLLGHDVVTV